MTQKENTIRAVRFDHPDSIPVMFGIGANCWNYYDRNRLWDLMEAHPYLFPDFERPDPSWSPSYKPFRIAGKPYTDSWGCVWETVENGVTGGVIKHPIDDWSKLSDYTPPSPDHHDGWEPIDWSQKHRDLASARSSGDVAIGSLRHGHTFLTYTYIRGYENAIFDLVDAPPQSKRLFALIEEFNSAHVAKYIEAGVDWMGYPEDLGMQRGPMISPDLFRSRIKPIYKRLMEPARQAGVVIHMHSDGDIRELHEDLVETGVDVLNLQDLVNGVDWIAEHLKGRICIDLDIDRQNITRYGTPDQIRSHIADVVRSLGDPAGGLMLRFGLFPGAPIENIAALMDALEQNAQ